MEFRILCLLLFARITLLSQPDSSSVNVGARRALVAGGSALFTAGSLAALHQTWYSAYNTGKFHFFDDNGEWLQMDKAGHLCASYQSSRLMMEAFAWARFSRRTQLLLGGSLGCLYLTAVEVMDGYSSGWGYSWGDQASNVLGASTAILQEAAWGEQKIQLKYSYARSGLAQYNPGLLGDSWATRLLKDYNAQIYWVSFNPVKLLRPAAGFPRWLNLAFGYSAYGMTGGHENTFVANGSETLLFERKRQFLLSLDIDLTAIPCRSSFLKSVFSVFNVLKIPAPAFKIDKDGGQLLFL